ncbi:MAG: TraR/DksA family transcriptional regulator [Gemmataceae bacterium]|nr:TraR/DksA family transcriptional regulator [Gemmataceae bacterium]
MARREALLRLHKSLAARRTELRKRLAGELIDLRGFGGADQTGDVADAAFDSGSEEIASQLAELESRELNQIERAIYRIRQGTYGVCEGCQCKIPVARLNALPYSTACVKCQREMEVHGDWGAGRHENWEKVSDVERPQDENVDLNDLEMDLSK